MNAKITLGQAIDQVLGALEPLDKGSRATVLSAVCSHLQIAPPTPAKAANPTAGATPGPITEGQGKSKPPAVPAGLPPRDLDIRTLKKEKDPQSAAQMACLVGYYLSDLAPEADRKGTVIAADLERYFKQAAFPLPSKLSQVLVDCKRAGYMDSVSRGTYKLNAVGYNLVVQNLPANKAE